MGDETEPVRRVMVSAINEQIESNDGSAERARLEAQHGQVWNTEELSADFTVEGFMAPFIVATSNETGKKGTMLFQHMPRFYFDWNEI